MTLPLLTPTSARVAKLVSVGVDPRFLNAVAEETPLGKLQYLIRSSDAAYDYLPSILDDYSFLAGYEVTPLCNGAGDDELYVLLSNPRERRFVRFELEADVIYNDFGADFQRVLAYILLDYVGFDEQMTLADHIALAQSVGLHHAAAVYHAYQALPADADIAAWQQHQLPQLLEQADA
ncbi:hypothetical protein [Shewanella sp.]|uniref:hypothetical protein n=1 Tax=Shewanella sp. TaxID=50422 RepID=UPI003A981166